MSDCDRHEVLISSWIDGEIDRAEQVEMLDHLVRCARCREFYLGARSLSGLLAAAGVAAAAEVPSPEVWTRIEHAADSGGSDQASGAGRAWASRVPRGALAAAAAVLVVVLGAFVARRSWPPASPEPQRQVISLGEDAGRMDDARFVALTAEVLRADRRYRTAFYEVMRQVTLDTGETEASVDIRRPEGGGREGGITP